MAEAGGFEEKGDLRILLIGRTGHGKSSSGNTILGKDVFKVEKSPTSVTKTCEFEKCRRFGRMVHVVDSPGFFDTNLSQQEIQKELLKALAFTTPGFHAIVFVLKPDRFTEELQKTKDLFFDWFGEGVEKHALMVLTDTQNKNEVDKFFGNASSDLIQLRNMCGDVVVPFDNIHTERQSEQVQHLFQCIDNIVSKRGSHFDNFMYKLAMRYIEEKYPKELSEESLIVLEKARVNIPDLRTRFRFIDRPNADNPRLSGNLTIIYESQSGIYRDSRRNDSTSSTDEVYTSNSNAAPSLTQQHQIDNGSDTLHDLSAAGENHSEDSIPDISSAIDSSDQRQADGMNFPNQKQTFRPTSRKYREFGEDFEVKPQNTGISARHCKYVQPDNASINSRVDEHHIKMPRTASDRKPISRSDKLDPVGQFMDDMENPTKFARFKNFCHKAIQSLLDKLGCTII